MGDAKTSDRIKDVGRLEKPRRAGGYSYHQSKNLVSWGRSVRAVPIFGMPSMIDSLEVQVLSPARWRRRSSEA